MAQVQVHATMVEDASFSSRLTAPGSAPSPMKISVAMATYNGERFLQEQLDSIAGQSRLPDELVVCDDGSSDRTLEIINEFTRTAPFPVRIHKNPERLGYGDNFLQAAAKCHGDWIAFCDQDDIWLPEKLRTIERYFRIQHHDVVLVVHNALVVDHTLVGTGIKYPNIKKIQVRRGSDLPALWFTGGLTMAFRADLITRCPPSGRGPGHGMPQEPLAHDAWICWLACILGDIVMLPDTLVLYRRHSSSTTANLAGSAGAIRASRRMGRMIAGALADRDALVYQQMSTAMIAHSDAFGRLASIHDGSPWHEKFRVAQQRYKSHAQWLAVRGAAYGGSHIGSRAAHLWRALRMGGYVRYYGNDLLLGARALLKDAFASAVGDARRQRIIRRVLKN